MEYNIKYILYILLSCGLYKKIIIYQPNSINVVID